MKNVLNGLIALCSVPAFANANGLCIAKYKTTSITEGPALMDLFYGHESAYSEKDKQACLCTIAKSVDTFQRDQALKVNSVKVRWMPGKVVGNYVVYDKTKAEKFSVQEIFDACQ